MDTWERWKCTTCKENDCCSKEVCPIPSPAMNGVKGAVSNLNQGLCVCGAKPPQEGLNCTECGWPGDLGVSQKKGDIGEHSH